MIYYSCLKKRYSIVKLVLITPVSQSCAVALDKISKVLLRMLYYHNHICEYKSYKHMQSNRHNNANTHRWWCKTLKRYDIMSAEAQLAWCTANRFMTQLTTSCIRSGGICLCNNLRNSISWKVQINQEIFLFQGTGLDTLVLSYLLNYRCRENTITEMSHQINNVFLNYCS